MPLTRAQAEQLLITRMGRLMAAAELDTTTTTGANTDLTDPIGWALRQLGISVPNITSVTDADVAQVQDANQDLFFDLAELRTLETIGGNLDLVDLQVGPRSEKLSQLVGQVERAISRKHAQLKTRHGWGLGTLTGGSILLTFQDNTEAAD